MCQFVIIVCTLYIEELAIIDAYDQPQAELDRCIH